MTQIASLLAVATVFVDLWAPFYSQGGGGVIAGFYGTYEQTHTN